MLLTLIDRVGEMNPQLFRELKGRLKPRNLAIAAGISIVGQVLVYLFYRGTLPLPPNQMVTPTPDVFNRYCIGSPPPGWNGYSSYPHTNDNYCVKDLLGNWVINWQLWWLDIFIAIAMIGIFVLLVAGTYLLIADLSKEENRGTLNFIRLSPQSAKNILIGKMLGVPALIYLVGILALPLHLMAGLSARIPLSLILAFYAVLAASCVFFYSAALFFALVSTGLGGFQAWLGSGTVSFFLFVMTGITMSNDVIPTHTAVDWLALFYPGTTLSYLVHATWLPPKAIGYLNLGLEYVGDWKGDRGDGLANLLWYGQPLWKSAWSGISLTLLHYGLWIYWFGRGLKRRFHNPLSTVLSKRDSYWICGSFIGVILGFTLQTTDAHRLSENFAVLQLFVVLFFLLLIACLSPHRQSLQDWARYRHQVSRERRNILKDLIWGEKSPATLAIALNLGIVAVFMVPSILLFPLGEYKLSTLIGLLLGMNMLSIYAVLAQWMLLMKTAKRSIWTAATVGAFIILPIVGFAIFEIEPTQTPVLWFFSFLPAVATQHTTATAALMAILGQWLAITLAGFQMTKQLKRAGASSTKALLAGSQS